MFAWNPINLCDTEAQWIVTECMVLLSACLASKALGLLLRMIANYTLKAQSYAQSLYAPAIVCLWTVVAFLSLDIVTDGSFSDRYPHAVISFLQIGGVVFIGWAALRVKKVFISNMQDNIDHMSAVAISKLLSAVIIVCMVMFVHDITGMQLTDVIS